MQRRRLLLGVASVAISPIMAKATLGDGVAHPEIMGIDLAVEGSDFTGVCFFVRPRSYGKSVFLRMHMKHILRMKHIWKPRGHR